SPINRAMPAVQTGFLACLWLQRCSPHEQETAMATLSATRPEFDTVIQDIADYVLGNETGTELARHTARHCLIDSLGCALEALSYPACTKLLGPLVPGTTVPHGARVPGTSFELDPVQAAFDIGTLVRWLDFNDT